MLRVTRKEKGKDDDIETLGRLLLRAKTKHNLKRSKIPHLTQVKFLSFLHFCFNLFSTPHYPNPANSPIYPISPLIY